MRASGNGTPDICVQNLLRTIRGEVPYERLKGIDRTLIDQPSEIAGPALVADVEFVVKTYEPRVSLDSVTLSGLAAQMGRFDLDTEIHSISGTRKDSAL